MPRGAVLRYDGRVKPFPLDRPCEASWDDMRPVRDGRHCASCDRVVYDLRRLSETRVLALATLLGPTGFCARQTLDEDGELLLAPPGALPGRRARWAGGALAVLGVAGCASAAVQPAARPALAVVTPAAACEPGPAAGAAPAAGRPPAGTPPVAADLDRDGVPDAADRCPDVPGAPPDGCPRPVKIGGVTPKVTAQIRFARRSTRLRGDMQPLLAELADLIRREPSIRRVALVGHASADEGPAPEARALGLRRAEAVRDALVTLGVEPQRLSASGATRGSEQPAAAPGEGSPLEAERRVEFVLCTDGACDGLPPG